MSTSHASDKLGAHLGRDELHVWQVALANPGIEEKKLRALLTPDEQKRADQFLFAPDCRSFIIRRAVLRTLLVRYLNRPACDVSFKYESHGKPGVVPIINPQEIQFSCSHSGELALIAVTHRQKIGVDLEQHRPLPDALDLARSFFSPREFAELQQIPPALQTKAFFDGWTRKEAFVKALGMGLSFPLHRFSVSLAPDQPARLLEVETDSSAVNRWSMQSLHLASDYSATLVVEGKPTAAACLEFQFPSLAAAAI